MDDLKPITINVSDKGEIQSVDWQQWLLTEIGTPGCTRDDVAKTYSYLLLERSQGKEAEWPRINKAISARWPKGLEYIKTKAWRLAAEKFHCWKCGKRGRAYGEACQSCKVGYFIAVERPDDIRQVCIKVEAKR